MANETISLHTGAHIVLAIKSEVKSGFVEIFLVSEPQLDFLCIFRRALDVEGVFA